jgi:hypothetical protein
MNRAIPWVIAGGVVVAAATAFVIAAPERDTGPVFIEGSRPVTEEQVRQKLVSDGWSGVQVLRRGRIVLAMGSKEGRTEAFAVDVLTGRLHKTDDDDDDD